MAGIIYFSNGNGYKLTGREKYASNLETAATTYIKLYDSDIGAVKCWGGSWSNTRFAVVTDILIYNEFLLSAYQLTKNISFFNVATEHINKTIEYNIREDGSCWQFVDYDVFGDPIGYNNTHAYQGAPNGTRWSRAHAWAINGLTQAFRYTRNGYYLESARRVADYFISALPEDFIPPSDFDAPYDEENGKDASAAAIACSGLFELAQHTGEEKYRKYADSIMISLCSPEYLSVSHDQSSILKRGQVRYTEPEKGLIYGDAFFLEAILKYKGLYKYYLTEEGPINFNPEANAGPDQTLTDSDLDGEERVILDGSSSKDRNDSIVLFQWMMDGLPAGEGEFITITLPAGIHHIALVVTDSYGKTGTDTTTVTILDGPTGGIVPLPEYKKLNAELFPNPAVDGYFSIRLTGLDPSEQVTIDLFNATGILLYSSAFTYQGESFRIFHNISCRGVCIVRITSRESVVSRKILLY